MRNTNISYRFEWQGTVANTEEIKKNEVWLDVGNGMQPGVLDHHKLSKKDAEKYPCAATIVEQNKNLISENIEKNASNVTIVAHRFPDFDCFASAYLAKNVIKVGRLPKNHKELVEYTEKVDTGRMKVKKDTIRTASSIAYAIAHTIDEKDIDKKSELMMKRGLELVEYTMQKIKKLRSNGKDVTLESKEIFGKGNPFEKEIRLLEENYKKYEEFVSNPGNVTQKMVKVPTIENPGIVKEVPGMIFNKYPEGIISPESIARENGAIYTSIPTQKEKETTFEGGEVLPTSKVIISVAPGAGVNLHHVGRAIEAANIEEENKLLGEKSIKRDKPRFSESPNNDPTYDGRGHGFTIIDAPRGGWLLDIERVNEIAGGYLEKSYDIHRVTDKGKVITEKDQGLEIK